MHFPDIGYTEEVRKLLQLSDMVCPMSTPASSIPAAIRDRISAPAHPRVWTPEDFADLGPRTAVDQALHRLVASRDLRRIARGFYDTPQDNRLTGKPTYPNPRDVIDALTRKGKVRVVVDGLTAANDLGLTDAVPARIAVLTDGRLRPITLGNLTLDFQAAAPSRLYWAGRPAMRFVQALHWLRDMLPADDGSQNGLSLKLSPTALEQGWVGIEKTSVESMGSAELEGVLQQYFYDGVSFRQLLSEPLLYGVAAWVIVAYLAFMMREDIGEEWRQLRRAVTEPKWASNHGGDWPENREGILARIRSRIAYWNRVKNVQLQWANLRAAISLRSSLKKSSNPESLRGSCPPASTEVQGEVSTAPQLANPLPSHSPKPSSQRRTIFPGSSPSDAAHSQSEPWDESEWID